VENYSGLIFLAIFGFIFYFILIRPQKRRQQLHRNLIESIRTDDEIVTIGGLYGVVKFVGEEDIQVEVAPGTTVRLLKTAVARRVTPDREGRDQEDEPLEIDAPGEEET
jgi:preprotein translocase subunit YajC